MSTIGAPPSHGQLGLPSGVSPVYSTSVAERVIPVVDIGPYRAGDPAGTKRVVETVGAACEHFLHPNYDARVACLPTCTDADHPPRHAPILAGEHMLAKLERREPRRAPAV